MFITNHMSVSPSPFFFNRFKKEWLCTSVLGLLGVGGSVQAAQSFWLGTYDSNFANASNWQNGLPYGLTGGTQNLILNLVASGAHNAVISGGNYTLDRVVIGQYNYSPGALTIEGGAKVKIKDFDIGVGNASTLDMQPNILNSPTPGLSTVLVRGVGTELIFNGSPTNYPNISYEYDGLLQVKEGAKLYLTGASPSISVGDTSRGNGKLEVDGIGSSVNMNQKYLTIGSYGRGQALFTNGSLLTNIYGLNVGRYNNSNGLLSIDHSTVNKATVVYIGNYGNGRLLVTNNSVFEATTMYIGYQPQSTGAMTIEDSIVRVSGDLAAGVSNSVNNTSAAVSTLALTRSTLSANNLSLGGGTYTTATLEMNDASKIDVRGTLTISSAATADAKVFTNGGSELKSGTGIILGKVAGATAEIYLGRTSGGQSTSAGKVNTSSIVFGSVNSKLHFGYTDASLVFATPLISSSNSSYGVVEQDAQGTTYLTNDNLNFSGSTHITKGMLALGQGGTQGNISGTIQIGAQGSLAFNRSDTLVMNALLSGSGQLVQSGTGMTHVVGNNSGFTGNGFVRSGTLKVGHQNALGGQNVGYQTDPNAVLDLTDFSVQLGKLENSGIVRIGANQSLTTQTFQQSSTGIIDIVAGTSLTQAAIVSVDTDLSGGVRLSGFSAGIGADIAKASLINSRDYLMISSQNAITGQFDSVVMPDIPVSTVGYLVRGTAVFSNDAKKFSIRNLGLAWVDGTDRTATGTFDMTTGSSFEVDIGLSDRTDLSGLTTANWDGTSLVKQGEGLLILSAPNSYTGGTDVQKGVLQIDADNRLGIASSLLKIGDGTLNVVDSFSSTRPVEFAAAQGTIAVADTHHLLWQGSLFGSGGLHKKGLGTLEVQANQVGYLGDTIISEGTLSFIGGLNYAGDIYNTGTLRVDTGTASGVLQGSMVGQQGSPGSVIKEGTGQLSLLGSVQNQDWLVREGSLRVHAARFIADVSLASNTTLELVNDAVDPVADVQAQIRVADGTSRLDKQGSGEVFFRYDQMSQLGAVSVSEGAFRIQSKSSDLNVPNPLQVLGDFKTAAGASTTLVGQNTYLNIEGTLEQAADSELRIAIDLSNPNQADIVANRIVADGKLYVIGFTEQRVGDISRYVRASEVENNDIQYSLLKISDTSNQTAQGRFENDPSVDSGTDYIIYHKTWSADQRELYIDNLQLAWTQGRAAKGTGTFTVDRGTGFDVDIDLSDQIISGGFSSGWDGKSLVKKGAGELVLTHSSSYSGTTEIQEGILRLGVDNALPNSSMVTIGAQGVMQLGTQQQTLNDVRLAGQLVFSSVLEGMPVARAVRANSRAVSENSGTELRVKNWHGENGTIALSAYFSDTGSYSDRLVLAAGGQADGQTYLAFHTQGGITERPTEGVLVVDAQAAGAHTTTDAFMLQGAVESGAFRFDLKRKGESWYLISQTSLEDQPSVVQPNIREDVFTYTRTQDILQISGLQSLANYWNRKAYLPPESKQNLWVHQEILRPEGGRNGYQSAINGDLPYRGTEAIFQVGADWWHQDRWQIGTYAGISDGSYSLERVQTGGRSRLKTQGYSLGSYLTYQSEQAYFDAVVQYTDYHQVDIETANYGTLKTSGEQWMTSLETGVPVPITENMQWLPQAQWVYQSTKTNRLMDGVSTIDMPTQEAHYGRLGSKLVYQAESDSTMQAWSDISLWHQFSGSSKVQVYDALTRYEQRGQETNTWAQLSVGSSGDFTQNLRGFVQVGVGHSIQNSGMKSFGAQLGLQYAW